MSKSAKKNSLKTLNKIQFKSNFCAYFKDKKESLLLFQNGLIESFLDEDQIISFITEEEKQVKEKDPKDEKTFLSTFSSYVQKSEVFNIEMFTFFNDYDAKTPFLFSFAQKAFLVDPLANERLSNKQFFVKIDPNNRPTINLENIDQLFLTGNFNIIDYSKSIFTLKNFSSGENSFKSILSKTSNEEYVRKSPKFNNLEFNAQYKDIIEASKNLGYFSDTIGFCLKKLTIFDLINFSSEIDKILSIFDINHEKDTNSNKKSDFKELKSLVKYFSPEIDYTQIVRSTSTRGGGRLLTSTTRTREDRIASKKRYTVTDFLNLNLDDFNNSNQELTEEQRNKAKNLQKEIKKALRKTELSSEGIDLLKENIYTLSYFSAFNNVKNESFLNKSINSNFRLKVRQNPKDSENAIVETEELPSTEIRSVSLVSSKKLLQHISTVNYKYKVPLKSKEYTVNSTIEEINKKFSKIPNNPQASLIKDISLEENQQTGKEFISIKVEYSLANGIYKNFLFNNSIKEIEDLDYSSFHLFMPEICLSTINGNIALLEKDITSQIFKPIQIIDDTQVGNPIITIGQKVTGFYKVYIEDIFNNVEPVDLNNLYFLNNLYNKTFLCAGESKSNLIKTFKSSTVPSSSRFFDFKKHSIKFNLDPEEKKEKGKEDSKKVKINNVTYKAINSTKSKTFENSKLPKTEELVLKVSKSGTIPQEINEENPLISATSVEELDGIEQVKNLQTALLYVGNSSIIREWHTLNNVSEKKTKGSRRNFSDKYKRSIKFLHSFDAYLNRRGNLQPMLMRIIESAFELTKNIYPELTGVTITSTSGMPITTWVDVIDIISKTYGDSIATKSALREKNIFIDMPDFNNQTKGEANRKELLFQYNLVLNKLLTRTENIAEINHSLGFAADLFLERIYEDEETGEKKSGRVCLYEPKDDKDFKIMDYFIKKCFELGANSVGAGMYYMDRPRKKVYKAKNGNGGEYKSIKDDPELQKHNNKIILDENNVPLRNKGIKYNAIHVDIVQYDETPEFIRDNSEYLSKVSSYVAEYEKINNALFVKNRQGQLEKKFTQAGTALYSTRNTAGARGIIDSVLKSTFDPELRYKFTRDVLKIKTKPHTFKAIWGARGTRKYSDAWLAKYATGSFADRTGISQAFNVDQITSENSSKFAAAQFLVDLSHGQDKKKFAQETDDHHNFTKGAFSKAIPVAVIKKDDE